MSFSNSSCLISSSSSAKIIGSTSAFLAISKKKTVKEGFNNSATSGVIKLSSSNNSLVLSSDGPYFVSSSDFQVGLGGAITASAGTIGGWIIKSTTLSSSNNSLVLSSDGPYFVSSSDFQVGLGGAITASAGTVGGWIIKSTTLSSSNNALVLSSDGPYYISSSDFQVGLGGAITASAGTIAGWTFDDKKFTGDNVIISSSGTIQTADFQSALVGTGQGWRIGKDGIAEFEEARIRGTLSTAVFEKETISAVGGALMVANATALKSGSLILSNLVHTSHATTVDDATINSTTQVTFNSTAGLDRVRPITPQTGNHAMISGRVYRAKATISSYAGSGTIGFSSTGGIDGTDGRRSSNGEIDTIFTYTSGDVHLFSNVNNSGVISNITIEEMSIPVDSTAGFAVGEYILAKATSSTGFTEEIMKVASLESASLDLLIVSRSMNDNIITSMSAGQVVVSQGGSGSGYILLNATSGSETPYIDIVERTSTGIDDLDIKVRLGDLSGINDPQFGATDTMGFGLYTDNVYLKGTISASAGDIGGWSIQSDHIVDSNNRLKLEPNGTYPISASNFKVKNDGTVIATGGEIGNMLISETSMSSTTDKMKLYGDLLQFTGPDSTSFVRMMYIADNYWGIQGHVEGKTLLRLGNFGAALPNVISNITMSDGALSSGTSWAITGSTEETGVASFVSSSGFKVSQTGLVEATNFAEKVRNVTTSRSGSYIIDNPSDKGGCALVFDGSAGGEVVMNLQLNVAPRSGSSGRPLAPITDIILPYQSTGIQAEVNVIINCSNVTFDSAAIADGPSNVAK